MDTEEAWQQFKKGPSIQKSVDDSPSLRGQLDTIQAQLNEILTNSKRTAEIVPKILGDETAIDNANEEMAMQQQMQAQMGMPPGGMPPEAAGIPPEAAAGVPPEAAGVPPEAAAPAEGPGEDQMSEEELAQLLGNSAPPMAPPMPEPAPQMPPEAAMGAPAGPMPEVPPEAMGGVPPEAMVAEGAMPQMGGMDVVIGVLDDIGHKALDEGRTADVIEVAQAKEAVMSMIKSDSWLDDDIMDNGETFEKSDCESIEKDAAEASVSAGNASNADLADNPVEKTSHNDRFFNIVSGQDAARKIIDDDNAKISSKMRAMDVIRRAERGRLAVIDGANKEDHSEIVEGRVRYGNRSADLDAKEEKKRSDHNKINEKIKDKGYDAAERRGEDEAFGRATRKSAPVELPSFSEMMGVRKSNPKESMYDHYVSIKKSMMEPAGFSEESIAKSATESIEKGYTKEYIVLDRNPGHRMYGPQRIQYVRDDLGSDLAVDMSTPEDKVPMDELNFYPMTMRFRESAGEQTMTKENIQKSEEDFEEEGQPVDDSVIDEIMDGQSEDENVLAIIDAVAEFCAENDITIEDLEAMSDDEISEIIETAISGGDVPEEPIEDYDEDATEEIPEAEGEEEPADEEIEKSASIEKADGESIEKKWAPVRGMHDPESSNHEPININEMSEKEYEDAMEAERQDFTRRKKARDAKIAAWKAKKFGTGRGASANPVQSRDKKNVSKSAADDAEDGIASAHGCPMEGLHQGSPNDPDSIAASNPVNLPADKSEGTSHSVEGVMPNPGTQDPYGMPMAKPTTGPLKLGLNVMKSEEGKHIMSMKELLDVKKSQSRPDSNCGTNGDISRPELGAVKKSAEPIDFKVEGLAGFKKSAQQDWEEYKAFKAQREF